jgi:hypothetical protein
MSMVDLYIRPESIFEKTAGEVTLPEDPNSWPTEILQELYKQVPYVADFSPNVVMVKVDAERGYALGFIDIMSKTELQPSTSPESLEAAGLQRVRVPIIVSNRKLQPFDILLTDKNKMLPLTEERLSQAIFRPATFDITSRSPGDQSIVGDLYPPYRQNFGMGGGGSAGMGKTAAAKRVKLGSILEAILPTINDSDYQKFASVVARSEIQALMTKNATATTPALEVLSHFQGGSFQKRAAAIPHSIRPTVLQLSTLSDGTYQVKAASHTAWAPHTYVVDRGRAFHDFGAKVVLAADTTGAVTVVDGAEAAPEEAAGPGAAPVSKAGVYMVETAEGEQLEGWVIPNLLELDGTPMPIMLFTNGGQMAVQGEIAGTPSGGEVPLAEGPPQGHGCFVREGANGLEATIPMEIKGSITDAGEVRFATETYDGRPVDVAVQPNIQEITLGPDNHVLIPESFHWMPLQGEAVALAGGPDDVGKTAAILRSLAGSVVLRAGDTDNFSLSGGLLDKVAHEEREFIGIDQAMFLLGGLGVDPHQAAQKIAQAVTYRRPVEIRCSRTIKTAAELRGEAKVAAVKTLGQLPVLRRELFKEAAGIPDPVAVDTVLSLGFINPENMAHFVTFLPTLDEAQCKMCELLLGARLGARDIPSGPLEKAIRSVEEVIRGLKVMAFAQK